MQRAIPYMQFRGGSSKGIFLLASDLPADPVIRNRVLLAIMEGVGEGDVRQIDGMGGGTTLTSKVAVVSPSTHPGADLDYYFLQVVIGKGTVADSQSCGNLLAAVVPFAIEKGLLPVTGSKTAARVHLVNTGGSCEVVVQTPDGTVNYAGDVTIDGVPGTGAPVLCNYEDTVGSGCGALLPTGHAMDILDGIAVTCIDNGMPQVLIRAAALEITGYESPAVLNANEELKARLEVIRHEAGWLMNLGDVREQTVPKMCLIAPPVTGGIVHTRTFTPFSCHEAIGVLSAVSTATACLLPGTVADGVAQLPDHTATGYSVEHPLGAFTITFEFEQGETGVAVKKSGVVRTARLISRGEVFIPAGIIQ